MSNKLVIVKIGTSLLVDAEHQWRLEFIDSLSEQIATLRAADANLRFLVVSSGAVAGGLAHVNIDKNNKNNNNLSTTDLHLAAALGQMEQTNAWRNSFANHHLHAVQILLTHSDLSNRNHYLNTMSLLRRLLLRGFVPIINENDAIAFDNTRLGNNDILAARLANMLDATHLFILTENDGIYKVLSDPTSRIKSIEVNSNELSQVIVDSVKSAFGSGGMRSKLEAAQIALRGCCLTKIAGGNIPAILSNLLIDERQTHGTTLQGPSEQLPARKRWLAQAVNSQAALVIDAGAANALRERCSSLLPAGIVKLEGEFERGDVIKIVDEQGNIIANGLCNYYAYELSRLLSMNQKIHSRDISELLGYCREHEIVHRDNLLVFN